MLAMQGKRVIVGRSAVRASYGVRAVPENLLSCFLKQDCHAISLFFRVLLITYIERGEGNRGRKNFSGFFQKQFRLDPGFSPIDRGSNLFAVKQAAPPYKDIPDHSLTAVDIVRRGMVFLSQQGMRAVSQLHTQQANMTRVASYRKKVRHVITNQKTGKQGNAAVLYRRIGSTTYKVQVHFSDTAQDTLHDKILHLIQREASTNGLDCGTLDTPQMTQPLEGSSV